MADLRWLDPVRAGGWDDFAALSTRSSREAIPGDRTIRGEEWRSRASHQPPGASAHHVLAVVGGEPVGAGALALNDVRRETGEITALYVAPEHRRRGVGTALLGALQGVAAAAGRVRSDAFSLAGDPAAAGFARRHGATAGLSSEQSRCPTAAIDADLMRAWRDRAAARAGGYSLVAFDGVCPDELLDAYTAAVPIMNTAPHTEGHEEFTPSRDQLRDLLVAAVANGTGIWTVCARDDATGGFAGYTALYFPPDRPWLAAQGDTAVHPDHRGLGLGRWLKAHNALRLLAERPAVEFIETWNATENAAMLSINREMGFAVVARRQAWDVPV